MKLLFYVQETYTEKEGLCTRFIKGADFDRILKRGIRVVKCSLYGVYNLQYCIFVLCTL